MSAQDKVKQRGRRKIAKPRGGLRFERLEERFALAGDVFAGFDDITGNLTITGDTAENSIVVFFDDNAVPNELVVEGVEGSDTTVNGVAEARFPVLMGINEIDIRMDQARIPVRPRSPRGTLGVDTVVIGGFNMDGNLSIVGVHGGVVTMHDLNVGGTGELTFGAGISAAIPSTRVKTGSVLTVVNSSFAELNITTSTSNDVVTLTQLDVTGAATLETGAGADQIVGVDLEVDGVATVNTGADVDTVNISSVARTTAFHDDVFIDLGNGKFNELSLVGSLPDGDPNASLGLEIDRSLTVNARGSVDVIALAGVLVGVDLDITTSSGVDIIGATQLDVTGDLTIDTGSGADVVVLGRIPGFTGENTIGGETSLNTGNGNDVVVLAHTTFDGPVNISLGAGHDVLVMIDNEFNSTVSADGGAGFNTVVFDNTFDSLTNFRVRTAPNFVNAALVDFWLARAFDLFDKAFV